MPGEQEPNVGLGCVVGSIVAEQNRLRRLLSSKHLPAAVSFALAVAAEVRVANVIPVCLLAGKWNKKILFKGGWGRGVKLSPPYRAYTVPAYIKNRSDCTPLFVAIKSSRLRPQFGRGSRPTKTGNESEDENGEWFEKKGEKKPPTQNRQGTLQIASVV